MSTLRLALRAPRTKRSRRGLDLELAIEDRAADQSERDMDSGTTSPDMPAVFLCKQTNAAVGMPYECVVSEVGLLGLLEPSLPAVAATPSGSLAYQVREYLQAFIERDRSYCTRWISAGKRNSHARARERRCIVVREYDRSGAWSWRSISGDRSDESLLPRRGTWVIWSVGSSSATLCFERCRQGSLLTVLVVLEGWNNRGYGE
jgi:hypothetical protein